MITLRRRPPPPTSVLTPHHRAGLLAGSPPPADPSAPRSRSEFWTSRAAAWREHGEALVRFWIQDPGSWDAGADAERFGGYPCVIEPGGLGTRPAAWWEFDCPVEPRKPVEFEPTPEYRRHLGYQLGGGPNVDAALSEWLDFIESDAAYLARLGLLLDGEGEVLTDEDFDPVRRLRTCELTPRQRMQRRGTEGEDNLHYVRQVEWWGYK